MKRVAFGEPNSKHVNSASPTVNGFASARGRCRPARNPNSSKALARLWAAGKFSVPENRLSGQRVQPSGLRPHPALFHSELSHSLVNMAQWLTASTVSMSCRHGSEHGSKQQHVEPVCVDHLLAGGPIKDREAPVLGCHECNGIALILDELGCR